MDDKVVRIAVGLRLGVPLCQPHNCYHCGAAVDELATHGLRRWSHYGRIDGDGDGNVLERES